MERAEGNILRQVIDKASDNEAISKAEAGFVTMLVERFRSDIDKKQKTLMMLQGEIAQLKNNEQIIINLLENIMAASERDKARQETMARLKAAREDNPQEEVKDIPEENIEK
jgi:archaellum biogenesis ATPase FlaH